MILIIIQIKTTIQGIKIYGLFELCYEKGELKVSLFLLILKKSRVFKKTTVL